ncbi:hypothetical protein D9M72_397330 [compost metagenome]
MGPVQWLVGADGQADTVDGERVVLANPAQIVVEGAAIHHVVLGVDFEEAEVRTGIEHVPVMPGLEPDAGPGRQLAGRSVGQGGGGHGVRSCRAAVRPFYLP